MGVIARATDAGDRELVAAVRDGDDGAFEELYRRYSRRVAGYVCRMVGDPDRAEDVTQEAFFSALRRLRRTDSDIVFKPWIFEIAKNAAIDHFRRTSRAEEVSIHQEDGGLRPADQLRLVGGGPAPEAAYEGKERLDHLRGAFDELSDSHSRILVLRELEGLSYREIGERMDLTRPAVESTLFRARRRLNEEYADIDTGARCVAVTAAIARLAEGIESARDRRRVGSHASRCSSCRRHARELGVPVETPVRRRVAALLPLPALTRRRRGGGHDAGAATAANGGYASSMQQVAGTWAPAIVTTGAAEGTAHAWGKAAAIVATLALAGGGAAIQERINNPDRGVGAEQVAPADQGGAGDGGQGAVTRDGDGGSGEPGGPRRGDAGDGGTGSGSAGGVVPQTPSLPAPGSGSPGFTPPAFDAPSVGPPSEGVMPGPSEGGGVGDVTDGLDELSLPGRTVDDPAGDAFQAPGGAFAAPGGDLPAPGDGSGIDVPHLPAQPPAQVGVPPALRGAVGSPPAPPAASVPELQLPAG